MEAFYVSFHLAEEIFFSRCIEMVDLMGVGLTKHSCLESCGNRSLISVACYHPGLNVCIVQVLNEAFRIWAELFC